MHRWGISAGAACAMANMLWLPMVNAVPVPDSASPMPRVGNLYEITNDTETSSETDGSASGSSTDRDTLTERVLAVRADGLELEYDLPESATAQDRSISWQFPARIFKPDRGAPELLNPAELQARADRWLKSGGLSREACGHWGFSWTAQKIECDPQSVVQILARFDLGPSGLQEGASYRDPDASEAAPLKRASDASGARFVVEMPVSADAIRKQDAASDLVVAEILRKPLTAEAALQARAADSISGTITISFDMDAGGRIRRREKVTRLTDKRPDGRTETRVVTETTERRLVSSAAR